MKTLVKDNERTYSNYYWNKKGQIVNLKTKRVLKGCIDSHGLRVIALRTDQGKIVYKSYSKLKKFSYMKRHLPSNFDNYVDVFGYQNLYCFDPNDPTKVFSKTNLRFKKILINNRGYYFIRAGKGTLYLHIMLYESIYKYHFDKDKYELHHISGNKSQNTLQNLVLLTKEEHKKLHNELKGKKNEVERTHN